MKYKDGLELQSLRREQDHIHRLVRSMDERLDQLAESLLSPEPRGAVTEPPASPVPPPTPPSVVMEQRPARPTVDFSAAPPVDARPGQTPEPAAHAQQETPDAQ